MHFYGPFGIGRSLIYCQKAAWFTYLITISRSIEIESFMDIHIALGWAARRSSYPLSRQLILTLSTSSFQYLLIFKAFRWDYIDSRYSLSIFSPAVIKISPMRLHDVYIYYRREIDDISLHLIYRLMNGHLSFRALKKLPHFAYNDACQCHIMRHWPYRARHFTTECIWHSISMVRFLRYLADYLAFPLWLVGEKPLRSRHNARVSLGNILMFPKWNCLFLAHFRNYWAADETALLLPHYFDIRDISAFRPRRLFCASPLPYSKSITRFQRVRQVIIGER